MNEVSITRKTVLHWMFATLAASILLIGVLIYSVSRYKPQYHASAVLRELSY